jgi:DNA recombination protein RmuC
MNQTNLILILLVAGFAVLAYLQMRKKEEPKKEDNETLKVMMEWMKEIKQGTESSKQITEKNIQELNRAVSERLDNAGRVIASLTKELGGVAQIGPDIRRLAETLSSPKLRGNFGEEMLENLLGQVLPPSAYQIQYTFKTRETVDAVIKVSDKILPIDSKFSMENYRLFTQAKEEASAVNLKKAFLKDIRNRVNEIARKYILPHENTFDFALMFIPSEGVYMEVANDQETMDYARSKKVLFVGPSTLYLTLQTFLISLRGQQINKAAQQILTMVNSVKLENEKFGEIFRVAGRHIKDTSQAFDKAGQQYVKLQTQIDNAASLEMKAEEIESPKLPVQEK